jgi:hypothetical protein
MPHYEFYCERCKEVTLILSIGERRGEYTCRLRGKKLEPRMGTFFSQTSRKA